MKKYLYLLIVLGILFNAWSLSAQATNPDLIAQARKEGRLAWYTTVSIPESKQLIDMFEKQYPFIKVDLLRSGSGALVNRVMSEYAAKTILPMSCRERPRAAALPFSNRKIFLVVTIPPNTNFSRRS